MALAMVDLPDPETPLIMNTVLDDFIYVIVFGSLRNGKSKEGSFVEIVTSDKDETSEFTVGSISITSSSLVGKEKETYYNRKSGK